MLGPEPDGASVGKTDLQAFDFNRSLLHGHDPKLGQELALLVGELQAHLLEDRYFVEHLDGYLAAYRLHVGVTLGTRGHRRVEAPVTDSTRITHRLVPSLRKWFGVIRVFLAYSIRLGNATGSLQPNSSPRKERPLVPILQSALLFVLIIGLAGCGSIHAGWPGFPVSVGFPLGGLSKPRPFTLALAVESDPAGADVQLNGRLVGTTPTVVHMVFKRSFTGTCKAEPVHRLLVVKPGYRPAGLSYTCQLAWDLSEGPASGRHLAARLRLEPEW